MGFYADIVAHFSEEVCKKIADFIVSDDSKSPRWTDEGVLDSEVCTTDTVGGHVR